MHSTGQAWKAPMSCSYGAGVGKVLQDRPAAPTLPVDRMLFRAKSKCLCGNFLAFQVQSTLSPQISLCWDFCWDNRFCVGWDLQVRSSKVQGLVCMCVQPHSWGLQRAPCSYWAPRCACGSAASSWRPLQLLSRSRECRALSPDGNALSCLAVLTLTDSLLRIKVECPSGPSAVSEKLAPSPDRPLQPCCSPTFISKFIMHLSQELQAWGLALERPGKGSSAQRCFGFENSPTCT